MKRITGRFEAEIIVKKSRFIAIAQPITGLDDVKGIVKGIWDEHKDATHVVHAAVAGANGSLFSCSDDREPKNTAGRPALEVLKGSGITDIIVCLWRQRERSPQDCQNRGNNSKNPFLNTHRL